MRWLAINKPSRQCGDRRTRNSRGMVTAELAVSILTATMVAVVMCWGIHLIAIQTECRDIASQVARAEARGDYKAADEARQRAPQGASINVTRDGNDVEAEVSMQVRFGNLFSITVTGKAVMPREPGT